MAEPGPFRARFASLELTNFLSYRSARLDLGDFTALVGPNGSGKSNAIAALKLLRDIPTHGLPGATSRRGGFDQLRHRSASGPEDTSIRIEFYFDDPTSRSSYELALRPVDKGRYSVRSESAVLHLPGDSPNSFSRVGETLTMAAHGSTETSVKLAVSEGQSVVTLASAPGAQVVGQILQSVQTLETNPGRIGELQEPSSLREIESDGSNLASVVDEMTAAQRARLTQLVSAVVPGITRIEVVQVADKLNLQFVQGSRTFSAKQMSDGTLRVFAIMAALTHLPNTAMLAIEEPEIAIHLGAMRTLVDILRAYSDDSQILITTHSADIVDTLDVDDLRVVWTEDAASRIAPVAEHTRGPIHDGLISPGALLQANALDPSSPTTVAR